MNKSKVFAIISGAALILSVAFLGNFASAEKVSIVISGGSEHVLHSYLWVAKERGFFEKEGLDVTIKNEEGGTDVVSSISQGDNSIGVISIEKYLEEPGATSNIIPFKFFLYGASETSTYDTHLVASKLSGVKSVKDLKGKIVRLGAPATHIALENILAQHGLTMDDVVIDDTPSHQVLDALRSGDIDAAITYYPTMPVILASGDVTIITRDIFANYVMDNVPQSAIGVNADFARQNPEIVKSFLSAMEATFDYGDDHPEELVTAYAKLKEFDGSSWILDKDLVEKGASLMPRITIMDLDGFYVEDGKKETVYEVLQEYQDLLIEEEFVDEKASLQPMWDNYQAYISAHK